LRTLAAPNRFVCPSPIRNVVVKGAWLTKARAAPKIEFGLKIFKKDVFCVNGVRCAAAGDLAF